MSSIIENNNNNNKRHLAELSVRFENLKRLTTATAESKRALAELSVRSSNAWTAAKAEIACKDSSTKNVKRVCKSRKSVSFEQRIEELRVYKEKHGHINVKQKEDSSLYFFCNGIRRTRREKRVTRWNDTHIAKLDALGFNWAVTEPKSFEQRIEDLRVYKEKHGHVKVKKSDDSSLYQFCSDVRQTHRGKKRRCSLNDITA